ncbi:hypothetical protein QRB41_27365 [Mycobacterium avium subsp. hominissuis]|uniref:hypothetical protein n=1 Tax=Mycobacterium avium TaxID=1764 RepID=UPI000534176B|nr:hypothetical protein [Mycobacterium avium]MBZ4571565.1 hypothetical protein [Mycobacterium avium subsp. hominissuis]MDO2387037.1 hypothetical protein [Mycobacterium avium subsp. hominissuis]
MPDHDTPVTDHDDVQLPYMPPAEIDAKLNALGRERALLVSRRESLRVAARRAREGRHPNIPAAQRWEGEAATCETKVDALTARMAPYEQEYRRRGGWPRAFLVQNVGGHVHRSTSCTSCYPSTRYEWLTHYSGCSEDEIVYAAGELACTVCYPTAPVQVLTRVGEIRRRTDVEREQRAAQKAAKASAASAAAVTDPATGMTLYRTERAASNAIASALNSLLWYGDEHPSASEWRATTESAVRALAARNGQDAEALMTQYRAKADKKFSAEARKALRSHVAHGDIVVEDLVPGLQAWVKANGIPA